MTLDIIYPVRPGDSNEELRYSLRSIEANLPHGRVWMVGHKPGWVRNVEHLPGNRHGSPQLNLWHNLLTACRHPEVSDEVVIFNDDFYVTTPIPKVPILYRGYLDDHLARPRVQRGAEWWRQSLHTTLIALRTLGIDRPLSYELHVPFRADKAAMAEVLDRFATLDPQCPPQWRTLYGNLHQIGGTQHPDCKAYTRAAVGEPFHSTDDSSFRHFLAAFNRMFPRPSRYEAP